VDWIAVTRERVVTAFSAARRQMYEGWIVQYPEKAGRVDEIIANLVMEFRSGIEANAANYLDPDLTKLPQSCVRYCEILIMFHLCSEIGATVLDAELMSISKAEIFLREMYTGAFYITGGDGMTGHSPSYVTGVEHGVRALDG